MNIRINAQMENRFDTLSAIASIVPRGTYKSLQKLRSCGPFLRTPRRLTG